MGQFVKGDVVVVPFPFSDLSASKITEIIDRVTVMFMGDSNTTHEQSKLLKDVALEESVQTLESTE